MSESLVLGFAGGFFVGALVISFLFLAILPQWLRGKKVDPEHVKRAGLALALIAVFAFSLAAGSGASVSFAQETPVPLDIPINDIMISTNSWLTTFAPIAAIGIGISIALAVLGYLGKMIKSAFT